MRISFFDQNRDHRRDKEPPMIVCLEKEKDRFGVGRLRRKLFTRGSRGKERDKERTVCGSLVAEETVDGRKGAKRISETRWNDQETRGRRVALVQRAISITNNNKEEKKNNSYQQATRSTARAD
jgi:hypothetical protein